MPSFFCHAPDDNLVRDSDYMHTLAPQRIREPAPRDHMQLESCSGWPRMVWYGMVDVYDGYLAAEASGSSVTALGFTLRDPLSLFF
jgi:hypothetical protein